MFNAGSTWHHGAWLRNGSVGSSTFGSLVPRQSSADAIPASEWARDNLWQGTHDPVERGIFLLTVRAARPSRDGGLTP